jgi:DNA-binding transcriptional LysR family regulator
MNDFPEVRQLRYFLAVAEELHFGRAAKRLHMAQPPLSQQIRRLEEIIGCPLFLRTSRAVRLTPAGEFLLVRTRQILGKMHNDLESVRAVARGETGTLNLGFVGSAMLTKLPSILGRYRKLYHKVDLKLKEYYTARLIEALLDGEMDVGFLRDGGSHEELVMETVLSEPFLCVMPKMHPLATLRTVPVRRLKNEPFVLFSPTVGQEAWKRTLRICEAQGFQPKVVQEGPQWPTILRLVGAGLGVTIVPECVKQFADSEVVWRKISPGDALSTVDLAYRRDSSRPNAEAFCSLARKTFLSRSSRSL